MKLPTENSMKIGTDNSKPEKTDLEGRSESGSLCPVNLLACFKGMHCMGRLSEKTLVSLVLQFLPIFAQRVQRKQEKINRKGVKLRDKKFLNLIKQVCEKFQDLPDTEKALTYLQAYHSGSDVNHLGDSLAELLRALVSCDKASVAAALVAVAEDLLAVLPALFPDTFGAPNSCVPLPVHAGYSCALCEMAPIEGPRFEENGSNFCAECFVIKSLQGKTEEAKCHLAPKANKASGLAHWASLWDPSSPFLAPLAAPFAPFASQLNPGWLDGARFPEPMFVPQMQMSYQNWK
ncbi:unnamed protein product [Effrenium voratum]|nr:unnamed protein product [Effrenium voratum]CAJ1418591.1 unnamed protein product [Effrenium voratum]